MAGAIEQRLSDLGIDLPSAPQPAGSYVQHYTSGNLVFVAGQIPFWNGELKFQGKVGHDFSIEEGQEAAKICALNIIAQVKDAIGDLDKVVRIVKLSGFVNCPTDFADHPKVINGASDLMGEVFGEKGKHTRIALGAGSLPLNVAVEIDAIVEVE